MTKKLFNCFYQSWIVNFIVLVVIVMLSGLYYPIHSWLFTGEWRWDTFERSMRFYKACVPASFGVALILTFNKWLDIKDKAKKSDDSP